MVQSRVSSKGALPVLATARRVNGFATLDACHRHALARVAELGALVAAMEAGEITPAMRASAGAIAQFLGTEARRHHDDEERHVFPPLLASGDPGLVQTVLRLQQDHGWLEEDWLELEPHESIVYPEARKRIPQADLDGMAREMLGRRRIERRQPSAE